VSCSPTFKWFVGLLLPLTFIWKLAGGPGDPGETSSAVAQFLRQLHFEDVRIERGSLGDMWVVHAHRGECRLFVVELVSSNGWSRDLIQTLTDPSAELFIVSGGSVHDYSSTWLDAMDEIYLKTLRRIGFARAASSFAVVAAPMCAARQLPWNELSTDRRASRGTSSVGAGVT
jgi:hypothetical protein